MTYTWVPDLVVTIGVGLIAYSVAGPFWAGVSLIAMGLIMAFGSH